MRTKSSAGTVRGLPPLTTRPEAFTLSSRLHPPATQRASTAAAASKLFTSISGWCEGGGEPRRRRGSLRPPGSELAGDDVAVRLGQQVHPRHLVDAVLDEPHAPVRQA